MLEKAAYDYVAGGAGSEATVRANLEAFHRWRIVPRFLSDVTRRDLGVDVLGLRLPVPIMMAPIGVLSIVHKEADLAVAHAATAFGVPIDPEHGFVDHDGRRRRPAGRRSALVSALLAQGR